jgi:hypothetical protein
VAQLRYYSGVYLKCLRKTTKTVMTGCPQACVSPLDFQTMKLDVRTRASYRIQTIINIAEEDKIIENTQKTLV